MKHLKDLLAKTRSKKAHVDRVHSDRESVLEHAKASRIKGATTGGYAGQKWYPQPVHKEGHNKN